MFSRSFTDSSQLLISSEIIIREGTSGKVHVAIWWVSCFQSCNPLIFWHLIGVGCCSTSSDWSICIGCWWFPPPPTNLSHDYCMVLSIGLDWFESLDQVVYLLQLLVSELVIIVCHIIAWNSIFMWWSIDSSVKFSVWHIFITSYSAFNGVHMHGNIIWIINVSVMINYSTIL